MYKVKSITIEICASLLILLFVYTAVSKLLDFSTFRMQLGKSPFITGFAGVISYGLPILELVIAGLLLFKKTKMIGLYSSLLIMSMFTAYIYAMLNYSYYIPCSCGGVLASMTWGVHFWFNILFVVFAALGIFLS